MDVKRKTELATKLFGKISRKPPQQFCALLGPLFSYLDENLLAASLNRRP